MDRAKPRRCGCVTSIAGMTGTAAYDYVASRAEVDPKRVAVMGYSFGGYHAPRIVAFEKRYAAAVAFGAMHWNIYDWVASNKAKLAADPRRSSTSIFQFRWVRSKASRSEPNARFSCCTAR